MRTKQMISNISYNSIDFLKSKCDELVVCGDIDFYMFIFHHKEEDELSNHIHIILYPSHLIDTKKFEKHFIEFRLNESELPFVFPNHDKIQFHDKLNILILVLSFHHWKLFLK